MEIENKFDVVRFILGVLISFVVSCIASFAGPYLIKSLDGVVVNIVSVFPFIANWLLYMAFTQSSMKKGILFGFIFSIIHAFYVFALYMQFGKGTGTGWF